MPSSARLSYFDRLSSEFESRENDIPHKLQILREENQNLKIYKFCRIETALKILESSSLLLQPPDNFNDPFDCLSRVDVWGTNTRFEVSEEIWGQIEAITKNFPEKFQPKHVDIYKDLRLSYFYLATCFSSNCMSHLMWSHYSNSHRGICFEFDLSKIATEIHPCAYFDRMPEISWRSQDLRLALIKSHHWEYEQEWRFIRKSNRPVARVFGSLIQNQIYNNLQSDDERRELNEVVRPFGERLEAEQAASMSLGIVPTAIIYGASFDRNFSNQNSIAICRKIADIALDLKIECRRMVAESQKFELNVETLASPARSSWDFRPDLKRAIQISRMQETIEKATLEAATLSLSEDRK